MPTPDELSIPEKLADIQTTKTAIREAIVAKGVEVPEGTTFRAYAEKIGEISGGGSVETCNTTVATMIRDTHIVAFLDSNGELDLSSVEWGANGAVTKPVPLNSLIVVFVGNSQGTFEVSSNVTQFDTGYYNTGAGFFVITSPGDGHAMISYQ